ncbi:hypothetical protein ACW9UM_18700 (plasmid) [Marinovum sp. KMM 9989]
MTSVFGPVERLLVGAAFAGLLTVAGFQTGRLGAHFMYPTPQVAFGAVTRVRVFDDALEQEARAPEARVAAVFGTPNPPEAAPVVTEPAKIAVNTTYRLHGITVVGAGRWAMLSVDGANMLARMGDKLANGELVTDITPTAVVLSRDGDLTILEFARPTADGESEMQETRPELLADFNPVEAPPAVPRVTTVTAVEAPAAAPEVEELAQPPIEMQVLRRAIYAPNALSNVHFVRQRTLGGEIGWQLKWIKDSPLVDAAGLQRGDVLVSINGLPVGNSGGLQNLLLGLGKLETIEIRYERRNRPMRVTIPLINS